MYGTFIEHCTKMYIKYIYFEHDYDLLAALSRSGKSPSPEILEEL